MRYILLIFLSSFALAACGSGTAPDAGTTAATPDSRASALGPMERGAILYKRCRSCHTLDQGGRNKVGPNLWGIFGKTAGARDDFNYSAAMAGSDIVWTDETMSAYLEKPSTYIPGNRMSFAGLRKDEDRAAVILYLRANTGADEAGEADEAGD
jgi:cytochrome c